MSSRYHLLHFTYFLTHL